VDRAGCDAVEREAQDRDHADVAPVGEGALERGERDPAMAAHVERA
jgi:hypothetical protein